MSGVTRRRATKCNGTMVIAAVKTPMAIATIGFEANECAMATEAVATANNATNRRIVNRLKCVFVDLKPPPPCLRWRRGLQSK